VAAVELYGSTEQAGYWWEETGWLGSLGLKHGSMGVLAATSGHEANCSRSTRGTCHFSGVRVEGLARRGSQETSSLPPHCPLASRVVSRLWNSRSGISAPRLSWSYTSDGGRLSSPDHGISARDVSHPFDEGPGLDIWCVFVSAPPSPNHERVTQQLRMFSGL
jgi:hypothetical protein